MGDLAKQSERKLKKAGKRLTPQRRLILDILAEADAHLDAQALYERARLREARLSLATVYRTLSILKETGLVHELHLDHEHHHYELADKEEHSHLVCLGCGCVIEVDNAAFFEAATILSQAHGFHLASTQVELTGYCRECASERSGQWHAPDPFSCDVC
jgi:Fur family ferric uptake transcriptional regulator